MSALFELAKSLGIDPGPLNQADLQKQTCSAALKGMDTLKTEVKMLQNVTDGQQQYIYELSARVERLRSIANRIVKHKQPDGQFVVLTTHINELQDVIAETPPAALEALKDYHFREFCDCNVTARKMQMTASKGLKITGFLTDDGKCCIDGKVQPLEALKAQWQADAVREVAADIREMTAHHTQYSVSLMACRVDGMADSIERIEEVRQRTQEAGGE